MAVTVLEAEGLYQFFHIGDEETAALRGVSLAIAAGEIVAVTGPSGSGKSTLLNCLTGLDEPDAGAVTVGRDRITRRPEAVRARLRGQSFGILMQSGNLFQHLTVTQNVALQLRLLGRDDGGRTAGLIDEVGLSHRAGSLPAQLSGGETARAGLAVALAGDPPILVADEPTAEVDAATEAQLLDRFEKRRRDGRATLIATHSAALAAGVDRVVRLVDGQVHDG